MYNLSSNLAPILKPCAICAGGRVKVSCANRNNLVVVVGVGRDVQLGQRQAPEPLRQIDRAHGPAHVEHLHDVQATQRGHRSENLGKDLDEVVAQVQLLETRSPIDETRLG